MAWPTPQDYNEAIQNPRLNFGDAELKSGSPELTVLGLPRAITGGFASVYRVKCTSRDYAVRCFLREYADQQIRYAAISQCLAGIKLPFMVNFEFQNEGIKVAGRQYPILKMEWVQGQSLIEYVDRSLGSPQSLLSLANNWLVTVGELQSRGIGHGDLQHGNVLVSNDQLKLIDYDGMYVPALNGKPSHEVGHRNYQHPNRTEIDFGPHVDNFSTWVIYVSLLALSIEPLLRSKTGNGDEFLLFRREDYERPDASPIIAHLIAHPDQRLRTVSSLFQSLLYLMPHEVPALGGHVAQTQVQQSSFKPVKWWEGATTAEPQWQSTQNISSPQTPTTSHVPPPVDWIIDQVGSELSQTVQSFKLSPLVPRISLAIAILIFFCAPLLIPTIPIVISRISIAASFLVGAVSFYWLYSREPSVVSMRTVRKREGSASAAFAAVQTSIREVDNERKQSSDLLSKQEQDLSRLSADMDRKEQQEQSVNRAQLQGVMAKTNVQRQNLNQHETNALNKVQSTFGSAVLSFNRQLTDLDQSLSTQLQQALRTIQTRYVHEQLSRSNIRDASITGIGHAYKSRLQQNGCYTAADIDYNRVQYIDGIGQTRALALYNWRQGLERMAAARMPTALPQAEEQAIRTRYTQQRTAISQQRDLAQQRLSSEQQLVRNVYIKAREPLAKEEHDAQARMQQQASAIGARYQSQRATLAQTRVKVKGEFDVKQKALDDRSAELRKQAFKTNWELTKVRRELESYRDVTVANYALRLFIVRLSAQARPGVP